VYRVAEGGALAPIGETDANAYTDAAVEPGADYHYVIRPVGADGEDFEGAGQCSATAGGTSGPAAVSDLVCRPKDGKIDLVWSAVSGAASYRVLRSGTGDGTQEIADTVATVFADLGLVNGSIYRYEVVAVDSQGNAAPPSASATCTPVARGEGDPPPAVAAPSCRGKNDKVDVTWTPVPGAAFYRVSRNEPGQAPVVVGEVAGNVFADFGLPLDVAQQYAVASVSATGAEAAASAACDVTPRGRSEGNRPPVFTSEPLTSALELHYWWTQLAATDPDGDAVTYSLVSGPGGMASTSAGFVSWTPATEQIGTVAVEVRATDARGAYASQAFAVAVADFDEPPQITSVPPRVAQAGQAYAYDVEAFDPEGAALRFSFADAAPAGMTIDATTGLLSWSPSVSDSGRRTVRVRAADPSGAFDEQGFELDVFAGALDLLAPKGEFEVEVGETLDLEIRTNQPAATLYALPLPRGATSTGGRLRFTPTEDQVGSYAVAVKAKLGNVYDLERITIRVTRGNRAPVLTDPGAQQVAEGGELVVPLVASDPDGDPVTLAPGDALPTNALLDVVGNRLIFRPSYEQAGDFAVRIVASDGTASSEVTVPIEVSDREPPVGFSELVIDRVQSPTLQPRVRISGNVVGDPAGDPEPEAFVAISGVSPAIGRQGRTLDVTLTGLNTEFAAGQTAASFGEGISVDALTVLSPTSARATITIAPDATLGTRVVALAGNGPAASSIVTFVVEEGGTVVTGRLLDDFTGAPLAGARVAVNGTLLEAATDAEGRFRIDGVPSGPQQIVVLRNDYDAQTLEIAIASNVDLELPDPIELRALARPFVAGGSLPRAASAASVLDRGVATRGGGLTQEQAEAVVADTLVAVGGDLVGVRDESGAELNPEVRGSGLLVVNHLAVQAQARSLVEGGTYTLGEIGAILSDAFDWKGPRPDAAELRGALQAYANDAWENPGDPLNAMALVLLNEGNTLSPRPPVVSSATRFNRFQAFLLVHSILLPTIATLEASADQQLRDLGVDPNSVVPPEEYGDPVLPVDEVGAIRALGARLLAAIAPRAATAQGGAGVVIPEPNRIIQPYDAPFARSAFTRIAKYAGKNFVAQAFIGNALTALTAAAVQTAVAIAAGTTGGALGVVAAVGFVNAYIGGVVGAALEKLGFGLALAASASVTQPEPPIPERSFIDEVSQKFVLEFDRSVTETSPGTNGVNPLGLANYSYELFDFPDPRTTDVTRGVVMHTAVLSEPAEAPSKLRFAIPLARLASGVHFFRMATIRYVAESEYPLNAARATFPYDTQLGAEDVSIQETNLLQASFNLDDTEKVQFGDAALQRWNARRQGLPQIDAEIAKIDADYVALASTRHEINEEAVEAQRRFYDQNGRNVVKTEKLLDLAHQHGLAGGSPDDFLDPAHPKSAEALRILRQANDLDTLRPDVTRQMRDVADSSARVQRLTNSIGIHEKAKLEIQSARRQLITAPEGATRPISLRFETLDADGRLVTVERSITLDGQGTQLLTELENVETSRQTTATGQLEVATRVAKADRAGMGDLEIGAAKESFDTEISEKAAKAEQISKETARLDGERRALKKAEAVQRRENVRARYEYHKPKIQRVMNGLNVVAGVVTAKGMYDDYVNAFRVLYSDLSAAFMYVHPRRDFPDTSVVAHPNLFATNGVVLGKPGFEGNTRDGAIQTNYLDLIDEDEAFSAGFPPGFLSIDSKGRIYAINMNSTTRFSGRMFRYLPAQAMAREFVGTINYWSSLLQYGRPAQPVAMTNGFTRYNNRIIEALFLADVDLLDSSDTVQAGRPVLKQFPIELLEEGEAYFDPATRSHFVAQPYLEDLRFRFSGATNLVSYRNDDVSRLYVSDGSRILVVVEDLRTGIKETFTLIDDPTADWSGLAISTGSEPTLFFAEFSSGAVYALPIADAIAAEVQASRFLEACSLGRFGDGSVYDVEVNQNQRRLLATTRSGVDSVPMPLIVQANNPLFVVAMERQGRVYSPLDTPTLGEGRCKVFALTEADHERGTIDLSVTRVGPDGDAVREYTLQVAPGGPTRAVIP
jgi:hypothetical protein